MKVSLLVALATVVPFGFIVLAVIIAGRALLGLSTGPDMMGLADASWAAVARRLAAKAVAGLRRQFLAPA